jgi:hypothetical protein
VGLVGVGAVSAADRLQQVVVAQRFVQIHRLQDRCIKPGEQTRRDNAVTMRNCSGSPGSRKRSSRRSSSSLPRSYWRHSLSPEPTLITISLASGGTSSSSARL